MGKYRHVAKAVQDLHNKFGASVVSVQDGTPRLEDLNEYQLRVKEEAPLHQIPKTHLTQRQVRRAIWELRKEREWSESRGVVWSSVDEGSSFLGLAMLVPPSDPMPALTRVVVTGGEDSDG